MSDLAKCIGGRIRAYRTAKKYSQERLAELAGCHPTYIGQVERGEKNATIESVAKIAAALGVSLAKLFEAAEETAPQESIAYACYRFLAEKTETEQAHLYNLLLQMDKYKGN